MLDAHRLRVLVEVARSGSLSGAARALDYTQPAISHHIARLEDEVGMPLLLRVGRGVRLTEAGRRLTEHAEGVLARLHAAGEDMAALAGLRTGTVRVASFPSGSAAVLPPAMALLRREHPGIEVTLVEVEPPESLALLRAGECDVALAFDYPGLAQGDHDGLELVPLAEDPLLAVLPPGHPQADLDVVVLADLADETWIAGCPRCRAHLLHVCRAGGFEPPIAFATDDYVAVQHLVAAGLGIALLPALALEAARLPGVAVRDLDSRPARRIAAAVPARGPLAPAVAAMVGALRAVRGRAGGTGS